MELFTKSSVEAITKLMRYSDDSEMQVCFNKWNKSCEIYRALPVVKKDCVLRGIQNFNLILNICCH